MELGKMSIVDAGGKWLEISNASSVDGAGMPSTQKSMIPRYREGSKKKRRASLSKVCGLEGMMVPRVWPFLGDCKLSCLILTVVAAGFLSISGGSSR